MLLNIIPFVHNLLRCHVQAGDVVVDATAGNGHDTLFLAQCVGTHGRVYAFDIQEAALAATAARLKAAAMDAQVQMVAAGHETLAQWVQTPVSAVVFNCGYLPGGNKNCHTLADTTLAGMQQALALLQTRGLLVAVLYPGHEGGAEEAEAVAAWAAGLPQQQYAVLRYEFINRANRPPFAVVVEKQTGAI